MCSGEGREREREGGERRREIFKTSLRKVTINFPTCCAGQIYVIEGAIVSSSQS